METATKVRKLNGSGIKTVKSPINGKTKKPKIEREVIYSQENVAVKAPKKHDYFMRYFKAFIGDNGQKIGPYWRNGKPLGKIYLNCFFYGIDFEDLGKTITARIDVVKKTIHGPERKREFIMLNIVKTPDQWSYSKITFPKSDGSGIKIIGTDKEIVFKPIKQYTPPN